jgi:MFS family permease
MSATGASDGETNGHRAITVAVLMATWLQAVNITLPNAAVLHIQGTLSMTDDELGWVFTSYIAASAVTMPMTRWLAGRFGQKLIYQLSLARFALGLALDLLCRSAAGRLHFPDTRAVIAGKEGCAQSALRLFRPGDFLARPHRPANAPRPRRAT